MISVNAEGNSNLQVKQIRSLLKSNPDVLIVSPNETTPLTPIIDSVFKTGLPVILLDRGIRSKNYTTFIGADNYKIGKLAAKHLLNNFLEDSLKILHVKGLKGSSPSIGRAAGFDAILNQSKRPHAITYIQGDWTSNGLKEALAQQKIKFNVVYAHNDLMAGEVIKIAKAKNLLEKKHFVIGIDGLATAKGGISMVNNGTLDITMLHPSGGAEAIDPAIAILNGNSIPKEIDLATAIITSDYSSTLLLLEEKISNQEKVIANMQLLRQDIQEDFDAQQTILYISILFLFLVVGLGILLIINLKQKQKHNKQLNNQKELRDELIGVIAHDTLSPLTSLEGLLALYLEGDIEKDEFDQLLKSVKQNTLKTIASINESLDWAKAQLQSDEVKLQTIEVKDLFDTIGDRISAIYRLKDIEILNKLSLKTFVKGDVSLLKFSLKNILVNAAKFSFQGGKVELNGSKKGDKVILEIKDYGVGMDDQQLSKLFKPDMPSTLGTQNEKGTGLGLRQSFEFIEKWEEGFMLNLNPVKVHHF